MKVIQKYITIIIWVCSFLLTFVAKKGGYDADVTSLITIAMFSVSTIATIIYFLPLKDRNKAIIVLLMVGMSCQGASIAVGGNSGTFMISFLVLGMATLYLDPVILFVYSMIYIPVSIIIYIVNPVYIVGPVSPHSMGVFELVTYALICICCYIGAREGNKLMQESVQAEQEAKEKAEIIQEISKLAQQDALLLLENVTVSDDTVEILSGEADIVTENIENMKRSEDETMERLQKLNALIGHSTECIQENYGLVDALEENFHHVNENVDASMEFRTNASNALQEILLTIQNAVECIARSGKQTDEITMIVSDMEAIASRTNMLATNAAIEAARAGDKGQGFEIVAEQIRDLSVQSNEASEKIRVILNKIARALMATESKVNLGLQATEFGIGNLDHIGKGIETIHFYSRQSQETLDKEVSVFEKLKDEFASMVYEVERNIETARTNVDEIHVVADAVQSQINRTGLVSEHLKEMEGLTNQIQQHFA